MRNETARFDVAIAGEINLDLVLSGLPLEMPCKRELLADGFTMTLGSSSAILAHNLSVLGLSVTMATLAGHDELGRIALNRLREAKVDLHAVRFTDACSTGVTLLLPHGNQRHILTYPGSMARMTMDDLDLQHLSTARHFHLSSLYLQTALLPQVPELLAFLKRAGLTVSLDTNDDPDDQWEGLLDTILPLVDVFLPNEDEACRMTRTGSAEEAIALLGERVPLVVMKCGRRGAMVRQNHMTEVVAGVSVTPVDTIGAGDSFNAGFLYGYLRGLPVVDSARVGNVCGALSTQRPGGTEAFRDAGLLNAFLMEHGDFRQV